MLLFLYSILALAIQCEAALVHRGQHQGHGHWHHHKSHTTPASASASWLQTGASSGWYSSAASTATSASLGAASSLPVVSSTAAASSAAPSSDVSSLPTSLSSPSSTSSAPDLVSSTESASLITFSTQTQTVIPLSPSTTTSNSPPPTVITSSSVSTPTSNGSYWQPTPGTTWQIQLSAPITDFSSLPYSIVDIDLFDNPASTISTLHAQNIKVICYFSAGTYENWRPDASSFTSSDLGSAVDGWPGENWLQTNSANVRRIMTARIELAATKGCDGVDPDNVDGYSNSNGLGLTEADAVDYLGFLADTAHSKSLSIGLKNAGDIVGDVLPSMEWQVNEQCVEYSECDLFAPFVAAGKPVFHIEYPSDAPDVSSQVKQTSCGAPSGFSSVLKEMDLSAWIDAC